MKNIFNTVKLSKPKSNTFDLTHDVKMSGKMGELLPVLTLECMPGDNFQISADTLIRFAPLIAPVMHRMDVSIHYFFCPNRILWSAWEAFIVNEPTGGLPTITINAALTDDQERFLDYMGIPPWTGGGGTDQQVNALPLAAYQKIYNEYYRDQNLIAELSTDLSDGPQATGIFATMRRRAWEHDYFTSALPQPQKGAEVQLPLGTITLDPDWGVLPSVPTFEDVAGVKTPGDLSVGPLPFDVNASSNPGVSLAYNPDGSLINEPTTINTLRRAFKLQEWLERNARGGTRYIENILVHFGLKSSDKRLQRPEYITGVKSPVVVSEVLNTSGAFDPANPGDPGSPAQGNMSGHAVSVGTGNSGNYRVEEHGYIIGILSVMPKSCYQNGLPKTFIKTDPLDWPWPSFANIGEQEILNKEVLAYEPLGNEVFGYIPRYAEYKYMPSRVAGDFRSTLQFWHLGRVFSTASPPVLNQEFIEMDPEDVERIFAVNTEDDNLYMHILNKIKARRPLPVFGTPQL